MAVMKNRSGSLARLRKSYALVVLSLAKTDSPMLLYMSPRVACAVANPESISVARLTCGMAATGPLEKFTREPVLKAFSASIEAVVASGSGVSYFSTVASDSPTRVLNCLATCVRALRTSSLRAACTCCSSRMSPVRQFRARSPSTYWLPRLAIDPSSTAALAVRSQISRASSGVSRASAGWPISPRVR